MCKVLRLAHVNDVYCDTPGEKPAQFLEDLFKKGFQLREGSKAKRLKMSTKEVPFVISIEWADSFPLSH